MRHFLFIGLAVAAFSGATGSAQPGATVSVANWNIRSGMGIKALSGGIGPLFDSNTQNCSDPTRPMNAWGWHLPQDALTTAVASDPSVIALGLEEAWGCGSPGNVRAVLGWAFASAELNGTALLARHGIKGPLVTRRIGTNGIDALEDQYLFGADVCINPACGSTARVYVVHYVGVDAAQIALQTQNTIREVDALPNANTAIVVGDFNDHQFDWKRCGTLPLASPGMAVWAQNRFVDAWAFVRPGEDGDTGMWNRNGCGVENGGLFKRIDYVMARGFVPLAVDRWAMIRPGLEDAPSDHAGIIATLASGAVVTPPPPPPPPRTEIVLWPATQAVITGSRWQVVADNTAAGGAAIVNPNLGDAKVTTAAANPASFVDITFAADANTAYRLWMRAKAAGNSWASDSVLVQFSDSIDGAGRPVFRIGSTAATWWSLEEVVNQGVHGWGWQDNGYGAPGAVGPSIQFATSGPHTMRIQQREDGIVIDQIVLSTTRYATTAPGPQHDDHTILPQTH